MWTNKVPTTPLWWSELDWRGFFFLENTLCHGVPVGKCTSRHSPRTSHWNFKYLLHLVFPHVLRCKMSGTSMASPFFDEKKRTCYWVSVIHNLLSLLSSHPVIFCSVASLPCASLSTCQRLSTSMDRSSEDKSPSKDHRTRRAHRKSRYGCSKCRERRIKVWKRV